MARTIEAIVEEHAPACACADERARTVDAELELPPEVGRHAWRGWTRELTALIESLAVGPVHVLLLTQPGTQRYVEVVVGHGAVRIDVASNALLRRDRLAALDERRLVALGYRRPDATSPSWSLEETIGVAERIAELVAHTLVAVLRFDSRSPLVVDRFGADRPCRACSWAA